MSSKLVISVSAGLGDMISLLPILTEIKSPIIISDLYKELFSLYDMDIIWWDERKNEFQNIFWLAKKIWTINPGFVYGTYPNGRRINMLLALSPGIKIFCDDRNYSQKRLVSLAKKSPGSHPIYIPFGTKESYVSINSKILGVIPKYPFNLKEKEEYREEAEKFSKTPYAIIHPTSRYRTRQWDIKKFISISKRISNDGIKTVFVLGAGEEEHLKIIKTELEDYIKKGKICILYGESLLKVISYVKRARLFLGNDSAIAHIAGISGVKTFVIYGYTRYYHTAPYGAEIIRLELPCSPCYNFAKGEKIITKKCRYNILCLSGITENMVWEPIKNFLNQLK